MGYTAFLLAAFYSNLGMMKMMDKYGANLKIRTKAEGYTAIHMAA